MALYEKIHIYIYIYITLIKNEDLLWPTSSFALTHKLFCYLLGSSTGAVWGSSRRLKDSSTICGCVPRCLSFRPLLQYALLRTCCYNPCQQKQNMQKMSVQNATDICTVIHIDYCEWTRCMLALINYLPKLLYVLLWSDFHNVIKKGTEPSKYHFVFAPVESAPLYCMCLRHDAILHTKYWHYNWRWNYGNS